MFGVVYERWGMVASKGAPYAQAATASLGTISFRENLYFRYTKAPVNWLGKRELFWLLLLKRTGAIIGTYISENLNA